MFFKLKPPLRRAAAAGVVSIGFLITPAPAAVAACDGCVVAAVNAHKEEMIKQFGELKKLLGEQFKTVRQSIAQVEKDSMRAQADIGFMLPSRSCETATAGAAAGAAMVKAQVESYCNAEDVGSHGCTQASRRPDAQFQTETLFSGSGLGDKAEPTQPGTFLPEVLSFDDDQITDARRFIDNATDPYPIDDLPKELRETPQGKMVWLRRKLYEGRLSASRYSMNYALAWRVPAAALKGWLLAVWQESKAAEHQDELIAALPENISYLELLKTEVDRRFAAPTWYAGVAGNNQAANVRELAYMGALALNFQYLQLRQGERIEHLLARVNIGDAHLNERKALQEERVAAVNLVKTGATTGSSAPPPAPNPPPTPPEGENP